MKILVIGGGGREHAVLWALSRDSRKPELFCAPGNAGTAALAENVPVAADNIEAMLAWARVNKPALTVVGPEAPLCAGIVDRFQAVGHRVFGPCQAAARLEGSKLFSKEVMAAAGVPTAASASFADPDKALAYVRKNAGPLVIKADGLAAGKGVYVCATSAEAEAAVRSALVENRHGEAGRSILIEEFLEGEEVSMLALVDGNRAVLLDSAQDHKRIFDADQGPNTGGMGAYSPAPVMTEAWKPVIREQVFNRMLAELNRRGIVYKGVLYAGLMMTARGPLVLEFNCRFGDPETQALLPRLASDLIPALEACIDGTLQESHVAWKPAACVSIVIAARGYPDAYPKGHVIHGLEEAAQLDDTIVFHAGTSLKDGRVVTAGGRVLGVTALGATMSAAVRQAYRAADRITFDGMQMRRDIAARALRRGL
ncbi:MAG: phosphoribosylamine--glycine ligase [Kiritimatiellia bacterium]